MKIHHIGYITDNINETIKEFKELGYTEQDGVFNDSRQNCLICLLVSDYDCIELVQPLPDNVQMQKLLKKRGRSSYHICYEVEDVFETYKQFLQKEGWMNIFEPVIAPALNDKLVTYFYNTKIGFIEFVNSK